MNKAELWQFKVTDNVLSMVHGQFTTIRELYFPKEKICLNFAGGIAHCFYMTKGRHKNGKKIKTIGVEDDICKTLIEFIKHKHKLEDLQNWFAKISS